MTDRPEPTSPTAAEAGAVESAAPSTAARAIAFACILAGGAAGGFIGWAFVDLQCTGDCTTQTGIAGVLGALGAAFGVGVVATLALRAMGEWRVLQARGVTDEQLRAARRGDPRVARQHRPPRVR